MQTMMHAMVIRKFGGPEVFEPASVPVPDILPGHVLIKVAASSLNPLDVKIRSGSAPALAPSFPAILHEDVAGTVVAVGDGVTQWAIGDAVYGCAGGVRQTQGALAEFMLADARLIARKPEGISLETAALFPLAVITAWEAVMAPGFIRPGNKVLIHGASGGVGHLAAQLARLQGAFVFGTVTSRQKAEIAREYGTDIVIVAGEQPIADTVAQYTGGKGFDAVIDTIGGAHLAESFEAVKPEGSVCTINARTTLDIGPMHQKALTLRVVFMLLPLLNGEGRERHGDILTRVSELIQSGALRVHPADRIFGFDEVAEAHRYYETHQAVGKISLVNPFG